MTDSKAFALPVAAFLLAMVALFLIFLVARSVREDEEPQPSKWVEAIYPKGAKVKHIGKTEWGSGAITNYRNIFRVDYEGTTYLVFDQSGVIVHKPASDWFPGAQKE